MNDLNNITATSPTIPPEVDHRENMVIFDSVSKIYPKSGSNSQSTLAVDSMSFKIKKAEIISILGPTGCGKSTAMNMIAGFESPSTGKVLLDGSPVTKPGPDRSIVFQQASLFPWLTVIENITLGVRSRGMPEETYMSRATQLLEAVRLTGFEKHYPYQLSGGMQQRVQIARALISEPGVILMDEPFGALDSQTRLMMQELMLELWQQYQPTIIFITHDVAEAVFVSDRVLLMTQRPGKVKLWVDIEEPKPRTQDFISSARFIQVQSDLLHALRNEVQETTSSAA